MAYLRGVRVPHRKNTAAAAPVRMPPPKMAVYPVQQHIGAPAAPVVRAGDKVCVGSLLCEATGFVSSPVYSGISGTVKKVEDVVISNGARVPAVFVESDGEMTHSPDIAPPVLESYDDFIAAVRASGIVGLGGAGFPTSVKLGVKDLSRIEAIIINGAECEPYITSDTRTMLDKAEAVSDGISLLEKYLCAKRIVIAIEKNKPECIEKMKQVAASHAQTTTVAVLPSVYPQGGEKVLIYHTTGKVVREGGLPIDAGAVVLNVTTLSAIAEYIKTGMPLVERCLTVDGSAVKEPKNVIAPIGTPAADVFAFCGGFVSEPAKVLYGGPMMGIAMPDLSCPVLKQTNAMLAFDARDAASPRTTACIRCGRCTNSCPLGLTPVAIAKAAAQKDMEALAALKVNLCMECGCCSYVCPAARPLVQQNKLAKAALADYNKKKKEAAK